MKCIGCGCTDDRACVGSCAWASQDPPICSVCAGDTPFRVFQGEYIDFNQPWVVVSPGPASKDRVVYASKERHLCDAVGTLLNTMIDAKPAIAADLLGTLDWFNKHGSTARLRKARKVRVP